MSHSRSILACVLVSLVSVAVRAGGPPTLSVELPSAAGLGRAAEGAVLVVRANQCGSAVGHPIQARAEGVVDGERRTVRLEPRLTGVEGVHAFRQDWPARGTWVLVFELDHHGRAVTVVPTDEAGRPRVDATTGRIVATSGAVRPAAAELDALLGFTRS